MKKYIGIVGSNADSSTNRQLLQFMQKHFQTEAEIELVEIKDLPLFNKPMNKNIPQEVQAMTQKVEAADGVIISTPEYDHSVPAALMNALHWLSYFNYPFIDKPVMITGASYGTLGSSRAQRHLRQMLDAPELQARIMPSSEFLLGHSLQAFDENGDLKDEQQVLKLEKIFKEFMAFSEVMNSIQTTAESRKAMISSFSWKNI